MSKNFTIALVAILGVVLGIGGTWLYLDQQRSGIEVNLGERGISVQTR